ncbi:MAG: DNA-binding protein [Bacteroidales bacterium]|nr:DNA-binding protein [Bacteroidales bacterium]
MTSKLLLSALLLCSSFAFGRLSAQGAEISPDFSTSHNTYSEAKPWCFWYWMHGAVTREGITTDLEAMHDVGLGGCYLMPIYGPDRQPELGGTLRQGTDEWWQMVDFALQEAARLNLKVGMHICDGFALAGGPWISPGQSMQMVVSTDTLLQLTRSIRFSEKLLPAAYRGKTDFYQDIAAYAIPVAPGEGKTYEAVSERFRSGQACSFTYTFDEPEPVTVTGLEISTYNNSMQALRMKVYAVDPVTQQEKLLKQIVPPRHGWQNYDFPTTVALPTTTTRQLRFEWTPEGSEEGSEDLDNAKWGKVLKIERLKILTQPCIDDWEGKSGRVWRVSSQTQNVTSAESYVRPEQMLHLTPGTKLPKGRWRIVRIGHSSTGHENATGGDAKGLECDKFSASATQSQLDHWFGEAFRRCNPRVVRQALKVMHIDSWECGCQNWSDSIPALLADTTATEGQVMNFAEYFQARHGYCLLPYLPAMVGIPVQDVETTERVLRDVRHTIAELIDRQFYPRLTAEAHRLGCKFSAESVAPTMIADGMQHYRQADLPMGEFWLNSPTHDKPNDMLDAISGAHIYGKPIIQAEGFTQLRGNFNETPALLKPLLDRQFCLGINRLVFHVMALNPDPTRQPGMTLDGIGLFFNPTQTWWTEASDFVKYAERCQTLLQQGRPVVDLAVYTGHEMPRRAILPNRMTIPDGYHYDSFNSDALLHPTDNAYTPAYKALIVPDARPMNPDNLPLPESAQEALRHLSIPVLHGSVSASQLQDLGIQPDAVLPDSILFTHRATKKSDIYFLSNQQNEAREISLRLRDHRNRPAYLYNPLADRYYRIGHEDGNVFLPMAAHGSCFILFSDIRFPVSELANNAGTPVEVQPMGKIRMEFLANGVQMETDDLDFDWTTSGNDSIRYYSGRVKYTFRFRYSPKKRTETLLYFKDLHDVASIRLNGQDCGCVWTAPYHADVSKVLRSGENLLEIEVANTWSNAIEGHDAGHDPFPHIWTNAKYRKADRFLLPAKLGGLQLLPASDK